MEDLLEAKIDALFRRAQKGTVATGRFYDPAEQYRAQRYLQQQGYGKEQYRFFGGYAEAERKALICLPDWCEDAFTPDLCALQCVEIKGSTFRHLSHPQYLGSLLSLGMERDTVGDIVPLDDCRAAVFLTAPMAEFLLSDLCPLKKVASDTVKVLPFTVPEGFCANRKTEILTDTVASTRLDCVVGALTRRSREKTKQLLLSGQVRCNYETVTAPDHLVAEGDVLSITGHGRYVIQNCTAHTKKDRIRLCAAHYIS